VDWKRKKWLATIENSPPPKGPIPADYEHRGVRENRRLSNDQANGCGPAISPLQTTLHKAGEDSTPTVVVAESCAAEHDTQAQPQEASCDPSGEHALGSGAKDTAIVCDSTTDPSPAANDVAVSHKESGIGRVDGTSGRPPDEMRMQSCPEAADRRGGDAIKKAVSDYVVQLLTPLYKTKKIQKEDFKAIVKKSTAKVMDRNSSKENALAVSEFLNLKRKVKIRSLVDMFIERHLKGESH